MLSNEDYQHIFHEIKNTITLISSSMQLIQKNHPEVRAFDYWDDTVSDVNSLKEIIIDLSTARVCENLHIAPNSIYMFLDDIKHATRATLENHIQCDYITETSLPLISFDPFRLKQAMLNLMKNAYEAMDGNGHLTIHTYTQKDQLMIDVIDTGSGISPEVQEEIFTPFFTSKSNGTGLGLCITKAIIEAHKGELTCHSVLGKGTTFHIQIPL